jgi:protoporphyrinogen oxidase
MKIAIIGAGFTGLAAADKLRQAGHQVMIFEAASEPGGLAAGFKAPNWQTAIEKHYHHVFTTDLFVRNWLKQLDLESQLTYSRVRTATLFDGTARSLDSAPSLLAYTPLSMFARLRLAFGLAFLKFWPWGQWLDRWTAAKWIKQIMGKEAWIKVWRPLFVGKFGRFAEKINLAWFWARIVARSSALGYYYGGFGELAKQVAQKLVDLGVGIKLSTPIKKLALNQRGWAVSWGDEQAIFDRVLIAAESQVAGFLLKSAVKTPAQKQWHAKLNQLKGLGATTLVLELDQPFFADQTYWLNINETNWPFLAVVEQTRLTGTAQYGGHTIVYVAKYTEAEGPEADAWFAQSEAELLKKYAPFLAKLSPDFERHVVAKWLFKTKFAQPLVFTNHHNTVPSLTPPWTGLYWASMQQVYPWDRGINFAVGIGQAVAAKMLNEAT